MSKKAKPHKNKHQQPAPQPQPAAHSKTDDDQSTSRTRTILDLVAIALGIIGVFLWAPSFLPDIHIDHREPLDPTLPFHTAFAVTNDGLLAVHDVFLVCKMNDFVLSDGSRPSIARFTILAFQTLRLGRGETIDVFCPAIEGLAPHTVRFASLDVIIKFNLFHTSHLACALFTTHFVGTELDWREGAEQDCSGIVKRMSTPQPLPFKSNN